MRAIAKNRTKPFSCILVGVYKIFRVGKDRGMVMIFCRKLLDISAFYINTGQ